MAEKMQSPQAARQLGAQIRQTSASQGISLHQLSRLTGVSAGQISKICRGRFKFLSPNAAKICNLLRLDPTPFLVHRAAAGRNRRTGVPTALDDVQRELARSWTRHHERRDAIAALVRAIGELIAPA